MAISDVPLAVPAAARIEKVREMSLGTYPEALDVRDNMATFW